MFEKVTPQKAIAFTRLSVSLCCGWPLPLDATNGQVLRHRILRAAAGLSALGLFLPVSYAMVLNYDDAIIFANAASMSLATFQLMLQLLVFGLLQDRFRCSSSVSANVFGGLLLLYTAAKFEILMIDFRAATTVDALTDCLKKYHAATRYAWQVVNGVQYIALGTIIINSVCVVLCGFNLIGKQPIVVKMQLIFLVGTSLLEVLMCAIPADHLMEMSEKVVRGAYEATWYEQGLAVQKTVLHITIPQKPVTITLKCFIPTLNLEYFCSYISSAFSLLTAVRAALSDSDDILPSMSSNNTYMMR
ncbi:uncharacterized protein LOC143174292 isoform X3 [Nomia melanderi]|uniref:uncharacterized protein LOC143174292 isoform X3 n=1 Tax=Nomia melanderi TaxID=2448451 RepID=UPI003FCD17E1